MSTYTSEPGTRLAGRYRLVDQVSAGTGWTLWKAIDETLARPVSVLTFAPGFPRIPEVVTAARAASRLTDPRMAQVFDVEDGAGGAYIVLEWVGGDSLSDLLDGGPLEPALACSLITDAARALAGAHALGQAHLRLTPDTLRWTRGSGIKITGLGIDAALAGDGLTGAAAADPSLADTAGVAALLYAALTGYWPGGEPTRLPPAPVSDGAPCTPRQVSADVSSGLDSVVTRALLQRATRQGGPIQSPAEFAEALAEVAPPAPLPEPAPAMPAGYSGYGGYDQQSPETWPVPDRGPGGTAPYLPPPPNRYQGGTPAGGQRRGGRGMLVVAVVAVLAIIAVAVWAIGFRGSNTPKPTSAAKPTPSVSTPAAGSTATVLTPASDITYNPYGTPPGNTENQSTEGNAIDGSTATAWTTSWYLDHPKFGGLKPGTGLLINLGQKVSLSQVEVQFSATGDTTAAIYLGNTAAISQAAMQGFTLVSPSASASGVHNFPVSSKATGQYVLIWLTSLPKLASAPSGAPAGHTYYEGSIYNVTVRGTAAGSS